MDKLRVTWALLALLGLAGCQTRHQDFGALPHPPQLASQKGGTIFTFVIHSDPSGAGIFLPQQTGADMRLGTTPLTLTARLERVPKSDAGGRSGMGDWRCYVNKGAPLMFGHNRDLISFRTPALILRKEGYEQERFSGSWVLPASLGKRPFPRKSAPPARRHQKTVVFKRPTSAQAGTTITIDCATGPARIHALDAQGKAGPPISTTPLVCRIGFAPERDAEGKIVNWRLWADKHPNLWKIAPNGDLFFNAILERAGYAPEKVRRHICNCGDAPPAQQTALFQMIRPTRPEAQFILSLDSLPSEASIYTLNADGSVGGEFGKTPLTLTIGMAQESMEDAPGTYLHKDWRLWAPVGLVWWSLLENGGLVVNLTCAIYKDGFAVEKIIRPIFELIPGQTFPEGLTLTVPLLSAEQAAIREARRLQQAEDHQPRPPVRVWQEPPQADAPEIGLDEAAEKTPQKDRLGPLWRRIKPALPK